MNSWMSQYKQKGVEWSTQDHWPLNSMVQKYDALIFATNTQPAVVYLFEASAPITFCLYLPKKYLSLTLLMHLFWDVIM